MAKISNTTAYPNQSPVNLTDYLIGTDAVGTGPSLQTKTFTVQALADVISQGQVTLQEVLDAGNTATQDIILTGNINLTGNLLGLGDITRTGNINLTGAASISTTLDVVGLSTLATVDINGGNIDNTVIGNSTASYAKFSTNGTNSAAQVVGNFTGAAALRVFQGPIQFGNTGGVGYGNVGDIIISNGSAGTPEWVSPGTLGSKNIVEDVHIKAASTGPATFPVGLPVYVAGTPSGPNNYITVDLINNAVAGEMPAIGLIKTAAAIGNDTQVVVNGELDINETLIAGTGGVGSVVYAIAYNAVTAQLGLTYDRPTASTDLVQNVGVITKIGAGGSMHVSSTQRSNDIPNLPGKSIFIGSNTLPNVGKAVDTNKITIDDSVTPAAKVYDIQMGGYPVDPSGLTSSLFRGFGYFDMSLDANFNLAIGNESMNGNGATFTGSSNTAVGITALGNITSGINNTTIGLNAGSGVTNTSGSSYLGYNSGRYINASDNTGIGKQALQGSGATQAPQNCVAIGASSLQSIQTGGNLNTAVGISAGFNNSTGTDNTYVGANAGSGGTTNSGNTAMGSSALLSAAGPESSAFGYKALFLTTGEGNTAVGYSAGSNLGATDFNTLIGANAGSGITTGSANIVVGNLAQDAGLLDGVAIGPQAGTKNTSVVIGGGTGGNGPSAIETDSVLLGYNAQSTQTAAAKGRGAVVIGANASSIDGSSTPAGVGGNIVIGKGANSAGDVSIAIGFNAAVAASGNSTVCIGGASGASGNSSVVIGDSAQGNHPSSIAIGVLAQTGAPQGTAIGQNSLAQDDSVALGFGSQAGPEGTAIGANSNSASATSQVAIGANASTVGGPAAPYIQFSEALANGYRNNTALLQFPNNGAALAGGLPVGALYIIGTTGAPVSDPAAIAMVMS